MGFVLLIAKGFFSFAGGKVEGRRRGWSREIDETAR
jgi:hypothetical protein